MESASGHHWWVFTLSLFKFQVWYIYERVVIDIVLRIKKWMF